MSAPERVIALWFPDWPVTAYLRTRAREIGAAPIDPSHPLALVRANRIIACSAPARAAGVRRGQRRRDAQSACPDLVLVAADPERDARAFGDALRVIDELSPGVQSPRPGLALLRARGPARFYGGEGKAVRALAGPLAEAGFADVRFGAADGVFAAQQASRAAAPAAPDIRPGGADAAVRIVEPGGAAAFLAPLPAAALGDDETAALLARLGVSTLGAFAALDGALVRERLGANGAFLHACASGADPRVVSPQQPAPDLAREIALEPPLELAEQVAFAARRTAESFHEGIAGIGSVCTAVRVTLVDDRDRRSERVWQHPGAFDPAAIVDRIRWQLSDAAGGAKGAAPLDGAIAFVRIEPEAIDDAAAHRPALIGQGPDERAHHAMTRLQAVLGHRGVLSPAVEGGRTADDREALRPWADGGRADPAGATAPWPGSLPAPLPAEVVRPPRPADVRAADGGACLVDERGLLTAAPATLDGRRIVSWAGPWPLVERDWDAERARRAHRFQLVTDAGAAWLASLTGDGWRLEGRYA